jgi:hypothetical protein
MQKWEYCSCFLNTIYEGYITFYRPVDTEIIQLQRDKSRGDKTINDAFYRSVAELGRDGWELVNVDGGTCHFKRPLPM